MYNYTVEKLLVSTGSIIFTAQIIPVKKTYQMTRNYFNTPMLLPEKKETFISTSISYNPAV